MGKQDWPSALVFGRLNQSDVGQMIEMDNQQKGILLAPTFRHVNHAGKTVGPVLSYFVAPQDTNVLCGAQENGTYGTEIQRIANLKNVCGHDGVPLNNDFEILQVAETIPKLLGLWHMPTLALFNGSTYGHGLGNSNTLAMHHHRGALKGTFNGSDYWSANVLIGNFAFQSTMNLSKCQQGNAHKALNNLPSRAVRAEIRSDL
jgi:hypothetical protein